MSFKMFEYPIDQSDLDTEDEDDDFVIVHRKHVENDDLLQSYVIIERKNCFETSTEGREDEQFEIISHEDLEDVKQDDGADKNVESILVQDEDAEEKIKNGVKEKAIIRSKSSVVYYKEKDFEAREEKAVNNIKKRIKRKNNSKPRLNRDPEFYKLSILSQSFDEDDEIEDDQCRAIDKILDGRGEAATNLFEDKEDDKKCNDYPSSNVEKSEETDDYHQAQILKKFFFGKAQRRREPNPTDEERAEQAKHKKIVEEKTQLDNNKHLPEESKKSTKSKPISDLEKMSTESLSVYSADSNTKNSNLFDIPSINSLDSPNNHIKKIPTIASSVDSADYNIRISNLFDISSLDDHKEELAKENKIYNKGSNIFSQIQFANRINKNIIDTISISDSSNSEDSDSIEILLDDQQEYNCGVVPDREQYVNNLEKEDDTDSLTSNSSISIVDISSEANSSDNKDSDNCSIISSSSASSNSFKKKTYNKTSPITVLSSDEQEESPDEDEVSDRLSTKTDSSHVKDNDSYSSAFSRSASLNSVNKQTDDEICSKADLFNDEEGEDTDTVISSTLYDQQEKETDKINALEKISTNSSDDDDNHEVRLNKSEEKTKVSDGEQEEETSEDNELKISTKVDSSDDQQENQEKLDVPTTNSSDAKHKDNCNNNELIISLFRISEDIFSKTNSSGDNQEDKTSTNADSSDNDDKYKTKSSSRQKVDDYASSTSSSSDYFKETTDTNDISAIKTDALNNSYNMRTSNKKPLKNDTKDEEADDECSATESSDDKQKKNNSTVHKKNSLFNQEKKTQLHKISERTDLHNKQEHNNVSKHIDKNDEESNDDDNILEEISTTRNVSSDNVPDVPTNVQKEENHQTNDNNESDKKTKENKDTDDESTNTQEEERKPEQKKANQPKKILTKSEKKKKKKKEKKKARR